MRESFLAQVRAGLMAGQVAMLAIGIIIGLALLRPVMAFTTAAEVRPILTVLRPNWINLREFDGQDLVYFTQIEAWRCGLDGLLYGINTTTADQTFTMEPCHEGATVPNAMLLKGHHPYITRPAGSVRSITVKLLYDDGTTDRATFQREDVKLP